MPWRAKGGRETGSRWDFRFKQESRQCWMVSGEAPPEETMKAGQTVDDCCTSRSVSRHPLREEVEWWSGGDDTTSRIGITPTKCPAISFIRSWS